MNISYSSPEPEPESHDHSYQPSSNKGNKYYKQAYRKEWESMPDFKGWLKGVEGQPTRAYCICCDKTLHAHRLSLLKHTCTLKHTKAAQRNFSLINGPSQSATTTTVVLIPKQTSSIKIAKENQSDSEPDIMNEEDLIEEEASDVHNHSDDGNEIPVDISLSAGEPVETEFEPLKKVPRLEMGNYEYPISTHVLDTAKGNPVGGLHVSLYKLIEGRWTSLSEGVTTPDGRFTEFIKRKDFTAGRYKMHFDVDLYFELRRLESLYPFIEIVFDVKAPAEHYHVPLLLSPFGYTTYRGT